ncbi:RNase adapter RapZ [Lactobacillus sp. S2-2]|uniref:RNase adapter RapZ n=1 Tax=Lactobacillus sp. S2-2 TaxID=2692917 RepID=UPI001EFF97AE|nr:RNase adapter RapZ [Lactobacillus sp. S2-2]MCF6515695.1 RNase adapter RapZ [Lactobacillus sp. S2-2]
MSEIKKFVIVTGMSGAGKTVAMQNFEDLGYFCVDNMPPSLLPKFKEMVNSSKEINKIALVLDFRAPAFYDEIIETLINLSNQKVLNSNVIFLDASDEQLVKRYSESKRIHPLSRGGRIIDGINKERNLLKDVKKSADIVIDTNDMTAKQLRSKIFHQFESDSSEPFYVDLMSFGFKYGLPIDADIVMDVRFLKNPFYIKELREKTGLNKEVYDYVMNQADTEEFYNQLLKLLKITIPKYQKEGKTNVTVAIGCTGGQHRSVSITERLVKDLKSDFIINTSHRDINRYIGDIY